MARRIKNFYLLFSAIIIFNAVTVFAQNDKADSLLRLLKTAKEKDKFSLYYDLSKTFYKSGKTTEAFDYATKALESAKKQNDAKSIALGYNQLGACHFAKNEFDKAIDFFTRSLAVSEKKNLKTEMLTSINEISVLAYYQQDYEKMLSFSVRALKLAQELKDTSKEAEAYNHLGLYHYVKSDFRKTLEYWEKELELKKMRGDKKEIAITYNNLGVIAKKKNDYEKAIEYYQENLKIQEQLKDTLRIAMSLSNIGSVYYDFGVDDNKALEFYQHSHELFTYLKDSNLIAGALINVGLVLERQKKIDQALKNYQQALRIARMINDKANIALAQNGISIILLKKGDFNGALQNSLQSLKIFEENGDKTGIAQCFRTIGECYSKLGNYDQSLSYYTKSIAIIREIGDNKALADAYKDLSLVYSAMGNFEKALSCYKTYSERKDSTLTDNYLKTIEEMQTKYETDKKQKEIALLNEKSARQEAENKRQRVMIYSFVGGFLLILGFSIILFRQFRQIRAQRDQIVHQKQEITDSIHYASRIQRAILPPKESFDSLLPQHFILYRPRDIVSGDFYWMINKGSKVIFTAADCTGHGVPGAFMSMLGTAFLNEIVSKHNENDIHADDILNDLRRHVVTALHQTGKEGESKDGMDLALCVIDLNTNLLEYAGANNPLFLIRKGQLMDYKADKMPIGIYHEKNNDFTANLIQLEKGDTIYVFSDGYVDQFGGPNKRKFMKKNFKETLLAIQDKTMPEQHDHLNKAIEDWMGELDQIDDILVIGVRI